MTYYICYGNLAILCVAKFAFVGILCSFLPCDAVLERYMLSSCVHCRSVRVQGVPIKNNPLGRMLYFRHDIIDLSQTFRLYM